MGVGEEITKVLARARSMKGSVGNEANTKALLIEPMLAALGWDTADLDHVVREWRVYDDTSLDYALKVDGKAVLFVEAKGIKKNLNDKQFIAQTINYANNEGVVWCVLTNGIAYRVYKTNEPVAMERKLLLEIDLADTTAGSAEDAVKSFQLLSRQSLVAGDLDLWGERVFTDTRVRKALSQLAASPPRGFLTAIEQALGAPAVARDRLQESLSRVFDGQVGAADEQAGRKIHSALGRQAKQTPPKKPGSEYPISHHLGGKSAAIVDIFEQIDEYARSLGADVTRRVHKQYVGYYRGRKSFFTIVLRRQRGIIQLGLDPAAARPWNSQVMRDITHTGHHGMGDTEYSARSAGSLDEVRRFIKLAYEKSS